MARYWWALVLRGVLAVVFVVAWAWLGLTLGALVLLFGAYAMVDGVFAVVAGVTSYGERRCWWAELLRGVAGIVVGLLTFAWPDLTALALLYFIAAWALVTGAFEIVAAVHLRRVIENEWLLALGGLASVVFGVLLVLFPGAGAVSLVWLIGSYAVVFGVLLVVLGFRLRGWRAATDPTAAPPPRSGGVR